MGRWEVEGSSGVVAARVSITKITGLLGVKIQPYLCRFFSNFLSGVNVISLSFYAAHSSNTPSLLIVYAQTSATSSRCVQLIINFQPVAI